MPQPSNRLPEDDQPSENTQAEDHAAEDDAKEQRRKKLAAIKKAVEAGEYDSEDVMDEALRSMLRRFDADDD